MAALVTFLSLTDKIYSNVASKDFFVWWPMQCFMHQRLNLRISLNNKRGSHFVAKIHHVILLITYCNISLFV